MREHWDEANARVLQRKAQLDAMLGDSQRYESRRRDADAWLTRMEARLGGMAPPAHTADVLELQLREQKVNNYSSSLYRIDIDHGFDTSSTYPDRPISLTPLYSVLLYKIIGFWCYVPRFV